MLSFYTLQGEAFNMELAPVVVIVYKREKHAKATLDALACNFLAKDSNVFIFSNAPRSEFEGIDQKKQDMIVEENKAVKNVRSLIKNYQGKFKNLKIIERTKHLGANESICNSIDSVINECGKAIILEEDIVTCRSFLDFMNQALEYYQMDKDIWDIVACNPMENEKNFKFDSFLSYTFMPWGWATWKDRWKTVDWDRKRENLLEIDLPQMRQYAKAFDTLIRHEVLYGKVNSLYWDYTFSITKLRLKKYTVFPVNMMSCNIGNDGSGENCILSTAMQKIKFDITYGKRKFIFSNKRIKDCYSNKEIENQVDLFCYAQLRDTITLNNAYYYELFYQWIRLTNQHATAIFDYFQQNNIHTLAIYGMGRGGNILYEDLMKYDKNMVKYAIDRDGKVDYQAITVKKIEDDLDPVDMIVVTVIKGFYDIKADLNKKFQCPIVSIIDVIYDSQLLYSKANVGIDRSSAISVIF